MTENVLKDCDSFYFVGIGGVSMSALAKILMSFGKRVGGYDRSLNEYTQELGGLGVCVDAGCGGCAKDYDCVVYTDAIPENNAIIIEARRNGKKLISRGELLHEVSKMFKKTIAISGCHGKTSCTSMLAHIFGTAKKSFAAHIGGSDLKYSNAYVGGYDYFITEACEYKKNFLRLSPDVAVVLNSDADHLECYGSVENIKIAYSAFCKNSGEVIKLYGDLDGVDGLTFGFDNRAGYHAKRIKNLSGKFSFTAYEGEGALGEINLNVYGKHNVLNALAAVAVSRACNIDFADIKSGLEGFCGVKRRFERIGKYKGAICVADYAHHPNEIKAAIKAARAVKHGEIYVVFQPHTYSRTKALFCEFKEVLSTIKKLMIYKTFAAREYFDDAGSALTLSQNVKRSVYGDCAQDIVKFLEGVDGEDLILFLGAGNIYDIAKNEVVEA